MPRAGIDLRTSEGSWLLIISKQSSLVTRDKPERQIIVITSSFTNLPWPENSEVIFRLSSQAATCPPVFHIRWFHIVCV